MPDRPAHSLNRPAILVVDDEEPVRKVTRAGLERSGYVVFEAPGGREALEFFQTHVRVDLVVTDLMMPGVCGRTLVQRLLELDPDLRFLVVSGSVPELPSHWPFLGKPFSAAELLEKVSGILGDPPI